MVARYVFPYFKQLNSQREQSNEWVRSSQKDFKASHEEATKQQIDRFNENQKVNKIVTL